MNYWVHVFQQLRGVTRQRFVALAWVLHLGHAVPCPARSQDQHSWEATSSWISMSCGESKGKVCACNWQFKVSQVSVTIRSSTHLAWGLGVHSSLWNGEEVKWGGGADLFLSSVFALFPTFCCGKIFECKFRVQVRGQKSFGVGGSEASGVGKQRYGVQSWLRAYLKSNGRARYFYIWTAKS